MTSKLLGQPGVVPQSADESKFKTQEKCEKHPKVHVLILGAAGRDFHNFLSYWAKQSHWCRIVGFTASTQIPGIANRRVPPEICGPDYPDGLQISPQDQLPQLIREHHVRICDLAYSDLSHNTVGDLGSVVNASGANMTTLAPEQTWLQSSKPVIAVCAVRTGAGKSQTTRYICSLAKKLGKKIVVCRHPMPYGDLLAQRVQRFEKYEDLERQHCTIEEREEYEAHIEAGNIVYAGVDYERILRQAEKEADVIIWDGGNNDASFFRPDLNIVVADALRPGHEKLFFPGETNARMADLLLINKVNSAKKEDIQSIHQNLSIMNPKAQILLCKSTLSAVVPMQGSQSREEQAQRMDLRGKTALVIEDGPTLTHGGMAYGAGYVLAMQEGATVLDPRPFLTGSLPAVFKMYPQLKEVLPAEGYGPQQIKDLSATVEAACKHCDFVIIGTPINMAKLIDIPKPVIRVKYALDPVDPAPLEAAVKKVFGARPPGQV